MANQSKQFYCLPDISQLLEWEGCLQLVRILVSGYYTSRSRIFCHHSGGTGRRFRASSNDGWSLMPRAENRTLLRQPWGHNVLSGVAGQPSFGHPFGYGSLGGAGGEQEGGRRSRTALTRPSDGLAPFLHVASSGSFSC